MVEPLVRGTTPGQAAARLVVLLALGLLLKNVLSYASTQISVRAQEGLVRDMRSRLFAHLLTLELGFFQRTRTGQLISAIITEVDQTKTVITAALLSFFQNLVVVAITLVILSQISLRLTLLTLAFVPVLVVGLQALLADFGVTRELAPKSGERLPRLLPSGLLPCGSFEHMARRTGKRRTFRPRPSAIGSASCEPSASLH